MPEGGPNGGDGGRGGDVTLVVDPGLTTLLDFRYKRQFTAERGRHGEGKNQHGRSGESITLRVPPGTVVREADSGRVLGDLTVPGQSLVVAAGGRGGRGNARFATPVNQAPQHAEPGEPGEARWITMELKLLADVGMVGYPNAGKSSLLGRLSAAKPKVAPYPFTTLVPALGVVRLPEGGGFVLADIPGLIEGAHAGAGLGLAFLRHIERTRVLIYVIDAAGSEGRDPVADFHAVRHELREHNSALAERPCLVAANKQDLEGAEAGYRRLVETLADEGIRVYLLSAATGAGLRELVYAVGETLARAPVPECPGGAATVFRPVERGFTLARDKDGVLVLSGRELERAAATADFDREEGRHRFKRYLHRHGVEAALKQAGVKPGESIRIGGRVFEWSPDD